MSRLRRPLILLHALCTLCLLRAGAGDTVEYKARKPPFGGRGYSYNDNIVRNVSCKNLIECTMVCISDEQCKAVNLGSFPWSGNQRGCQVISSLATSSAELLNTGQVTYYEVKPTQVASLTTTTATTTSTPRTTTTDTPTITTPAGTTTTDTPTTTTTTAGTKTTDTPTTTTTTTGTTTTDTSMTTTTAGTTTTYTPTTTSTTSGTTTTAAPTTTTTSGPTPPPDCSVSKCPANPALCTLTTCPGLPVTQDIDAAFWFNPNPGAGLKPTLLVGYTYYMYNSVADFNGGSPIAQGNLSDVFPDIVYSDWPLDGVGLTVYSFLGTYNEILLATGHVFYSYVFKTSTWYKGPDTPLVGGGWSDYILPISDNLGLDLPMDAYFFTNGGVFDKRLYGFKGCEVVSDGLCHPIYHQCNVDWAGFPNGATAMIQAQQNSGDDYIVFTGNVYYRYNKGSKTFTCEGRVTIP